jgi:hypothetical protein
MNITPVFRSMAEMSVFVAEDGSLWYWGKWVQGKNRVDTPVPLELPEELYPKNCEPVCTPYLIDSIMIPSAASPLFCCSRHLRNLPKHSVSPSFLIPLLSSPVPGS